MTWHSISCEHSPYSTIKAWEEIHRFGNLAAFFPMPFGKRLSTYLSYPARAVR